MAFVPESGGAHGKSGTENQKFIFLGLFRCEFAVVEG
jgi:hypothetical protein